MKWAVCVDVILHYIIFIIVYTQSLAHILQVLGAPVMQLLQHEVDRNKSLIQSLTAKKQELLVAIEKNKTV